MKLQPMCPYCGKKAKLVTGQDVYPARKDLWDKKIWQCRPCDARVGCHPDTEVPLGRLANASLRKAKQQAHAVFDPLWKNKLMSRKMAYGWLAEKLNIHWSKCHIGMFDEDQCARVVTVCLKYLNEKGVS